MCAACREHGLAPMVTFHHFTTPRWLAARGGWAEPSTVDRFARYCERATRHLGDLIARACTICEPNIVATMGYLYGLFPPGHRDAGLRRRATDVLIAAHGKAADAIHAGPGSASVGLTLAMFDCQAMPGAETERDRYRREMEDVFLEAVRKDDFMGLQCYSRMRIGPQGLLDPERDVRITQMGYEFWPEALEATLRYAWKVTGGVPLLVTENGVATDRPRSPAPRTAGCPRDSGASDRTSRRWVPGRACPARAPTPTSHCSSSHSPPGGRRSPCPRRSPREIAARPLRRRVLRACRAVKARSGGQRSGTSTATSSLE